MIIRKTIEQADPSLVNKAVDYCWNNKITSAMDFKEIVTQYQQVLPDKYYPKIISINPLGGALPNGAMVQPATSQIEDYQTIFKQK